MIGKAEEKTNSTPWGVYAGSSFDANSYAVVAGGDNSSYKKLSAAVHDKYDIGIASF